MSRKPRVYLADVPCHVIQRGNDRQPCFYSEEDYQFYLECLYDSCKRFSVDLHAYVLMTNYVHLLMTPKHRPLLLLFSVVTGPLYYFHCGSDQTIIVY